MGNKPKSLDNSVCMGFLGNYLTFSDVCASHPNIDDILTGCLQLASPGSTSTRTLSRHVLFGILTTVSQITTIEVSRATYHRYAESTVKVYTQTSRLLSKLLTPYIESLPVHLQHPAPSLWQSRKDLDAPYLAELNRILAALQNDLENGTCSVPKQGKAEWWLPDGTSHAQSINQGPLLDELRTRLPKLYSTEWHDSKS